jgi:hypothetical protein
MTMIATEEANWCGPAGLDWSGPNVLGRFAQALAAVQNVAKTQTADTGKYKYSYADLGDVLDECKRVCGEFYLSIVQIPGYDGDKLTMTTLILDNEGEYITFPPMGLRLPNEAQAVGSALTYIRRYSLLTIFGIAPEDDDGRAATAAARQEASGYRSGAEERIVSEIAALEPDKARVLRQRFRETFRSGLSDLPVSKHGDALQFVLDQIAANDFTEEVAVGPEGS